MFNLYVCYCFTVALTDFAQCFDFLPHYFWPQSFLNYVRAGRACIDEKVYSARPFFADRYLNSDPIISCPARFF